MRNMAENVDQLSNQLVSLYLISSAISSVLRMTRRIVKVRLKTSVKMTEGFLSITFHSEVGNS